VSVSAPGVSAARRRHARSSAWRDLLEDCFIIMTFDCAVGPPQTLIGRRRPARPRRRAARGLPEEIAEGAIFCSREPGFFALARMTC
jgi:hypothetical protein